MCMLQVAAGFELHVDHASTNFQERDTVTQLRHVHAAGLRRFCVAYWSCKYQLSSRRHSHTPSEQDTTLICACCRLLQALCCMLAMQVAASKWVTQSHAKWTRHGGSASYPTTPSLTSSTLLCGRFWVMMCIRKGPLCFQTSSGECTTKWSLEAC